MLSDARHILWRSEVCCLEPSQSRAHATSDADTAGWVSLCCEVQHLLKAVVKCACQVTMEGKDAVWRTLRPGG